MPIITQTNACLSAPTSRTTPTRIILPGFAWMSACPAVLAISPPSIAWNFAGGPTLLTPTTRTCVQYCPNGYFSDNSTATCKSQCPSGSFADPVTHRCLGHCPALHNYFDYSGNWTCLQTCPPGFYSNTDLGQCVSICNSSSSMFSYSPTNPVREGVPHPLPRVPSKQHLSALLPLSRVLLRRHDQPMLCVPHQLFHLRLPVDLQAVQNPALTYSTATAIRVASPPTSSPTPTLWECASWSALPAPTAIT
jgi:hypothetical protein